MDIRSYIKFPLNDREWGKKIVIGGLLSIIPIINLLVLGYYIRCIKLGMSNSYTLPQWNEWGELFNDGLYSFLITIVYLLLPILLSAALFNIPFVGVLLSIVITIFAGMMIFFALASYSVNKNFADAFDFQQVYKKLSEKMDRFIFPYLAFVLLSYIGSSLVLAIPFAGAIAILLVFYVGIVFSHYVGTVY
ncbi:hypothetical protein SYNTR_1617 [Candidatus Syntrophocurvum alkaliphilum]|uniref:DUF4013 domain-containing protein n=1 Tax=Candidatus Syntrophocurvum alkaliphilum TaxID=2293317 RepID=A0A6I6DJ76_9FIRM|nr:DUF4013 domain-containing protein [Candidatus Syntrophocurvum alkaliphilum]QGU00211.1 hypothetical protein SYNTR_1617 [Candidatus Syntrophocurvum alkaliphilum]